MTRRLKSQVNGTGNILILIAIILISFMLLSTANADIITPAYYLHWTDSTVTVGLGTTTNRLFNETSPGSVLKEESFSSNSCSDEDCPFYKFYSPVFDYDTNITGTQAFSLWMHIDDDIPSKDEISIDYVKLIDFDPGDASTTTIATNDTDVIMDTETYTEYLFTLPGVNYILPKGHRILAEIHPYVSIDEGSQSSKNLIFTIGYDTSARDSRVNLSYTNVTLTANMTSPASTTYGYPDVAFTMTCNATCTFGQCNDVILYPQYCTGIACTNFINMPNATSNLTTGNESYSAGNISNGETKGFVFTITENNAGEYRIRCNATSTNAAPDISAGEIKYVLASTVSQAEVEYENKNTYSAEEYETLDNITWLNITAIANSANATDINITSNILNPSSSIVTWGPNDNNECASFLEKGTTCETTFNNNSYGYIIPESEPSGTYTFNTSLLWSGTTSANTTETFTLHNLPANDFSHHTDPTPFKVIVGNKGTYNFSIHNPWSMNLTLVNISANCPNALGITCNCTLPGQVTQDYCYIGNITQGNTSHAAFNISTTASTPPGDYNLNITVTYTNPGSQSHTWTEVENTIFQALSAEDLITVIFNPPSKITRDTNKNIYGKTTYQGATSKTNVTLNWSIPATWSNTSGNLNEYIGTLNTGETGWNNITVSILLSEPPGQKRINLSSNATEGGYDDDYALIDIYADTAFYNLEVINLDSPAKPYDPIRGQTIRIKARLRYDNNTVISGETINFIDETDSILIGTNTTDPLGWAYLYYQIPSSSITGIHTINISYSTSQTLYTNPSYTTTDIHVHDITLIFNLQDTPATVGNGYPVKVSAEINDTNQIISAKIYINHSVYGEESYDMALVTGTNESGTWEYNYTAWLFGTYSYYIWANDGFGLENDTSHNLQYFSVDSKLSIRTITDKKEYGPNEDILIIAPHWWNTSFSYRLPITISSTSSETDIMITETIDFTHYLNELGAPETSLDNNSIRVIEWNTTAATNTEINSSFIETPPGEVNLWEISQDMPQPVDFTSGLNTTANTFGPAGSNDGWDWAGSVYGLSSTCISFNNADVGTDELLRITIGDTPCENDGQASGAYGVMLYIDSVAHTAISRGGKANLTFAWSVTDTGLDAGDVLWIKSRFGTSAQMNYLGSDLDTGDPLADGNKEVYFANDPVDTSNTSSFDITQYITNVGWYYLDMGLKIGDWDNGEYAYADFDNITFTINGSTYDEKTQATLDITWDMNGTTPQNIERTYYIYFDIKELQNKTYPTYTAPAGATPAGTLTKTLEEAQPRQSKVQNTGTTDVRYRTIMRIQRFVSGIWTNIGLPVIDDATTETTRDTQNNSVTYLGSIWDTEGWNTLTRPAGTYRLNISMFDANMPPVMLKDHNNAYLTAAYNFAIVSANIILTELKHENLNEYTINEYETGDTIAWINTTVRSENAKAIDANVTLNIQDSGKDSVSWGPQSETKDCGNINKGDTCEVKFDNSTDGYPIPTTAASGDYEFFWNIIMDSESSDSKQNNSINFTIHHLPDNFSSTLAPAKIYSGEYALYNFTIGNIWSKNITLVNITVAYPKIPGLTCNCTLAGQTEQDYCYLDNVTNKTDEIAPFNISTNSSTPAGDYNINVTATYTNPAGELHTWTGQVDRILQIRVGGELITNITKPKETTPLTKITRNGFTNLTGWANNTKTYSLYKVWANWTLPSDWSNHSGNLSEYTAELSGGTMIWNNITANVSIIAQLGQQQLKLKSSDNESREDWSTADILVYANTTLENFQSDDYTAVKGQAITLDIWLYYDNSTPVSDGNISFNDTTQPYYIGSDLTDNTGHATINYIIPGDAATGNHTLNASFRGSDTLYLNPVWTTINITINDNPTFTGTEATPNVVGYGYNVTIKTNISDDNTADKALVYITYPNATTIGFTMENSTPSNFSYNFTDTWQRGTYAYYIWANNTAGETNTSPTHYFYVSVNTSLITQTENTSYKANKDVNLTGAPSWWWNSSWQYRKQLNITEPGISNRTNWPVYANISTDGNGLNCTRDFRIIDDTGNETALKIISETYTDSGCQSSEFSFLVNISNSSTRTYYLYYTNPKATPPSYAIWSDSCSESTNATNCTGIYYSKKELPQGLDDDTGKTALIIDDEEVKNSYALPFTFPFFGASYTTVNIFDNGFVDFTDPTTDPSPSHSEFTSRKMIAVIWDDYDPWIGSNEDTYKKEYSDRVIYTWDTDTKEGGNQDVLIQMVLYDTGDIMFRYSTVNYDEATHLAGISKGDSTYFINNSHQQDDKTAFYQYYQAATPSIGEQESNNESKILNTGSTGIKGYLIMQVQKFTGGAWQVVDTVYNSLVTIGANSEYTIHDIWNTIGWNTAKNESGIYRAYTALTDSFGKILTNDNNENISATYNFSITEAVNLTFTAVRIYDVTGASYPKTDTSNLWASGLNTTFNLFINHTYRFEIELNNSITSEDNWTITSADNITHLYLNSSWQINETGEIWYKNNTQSFTNGTWDGNVTWNTTNSGILPVGGNMTFYYVFNITDGSQGPYPVRFTINTPEFTRDEHDTYIILDEDNGPPFLENNIYNLNATQLNRGNSLLLYAKWNETISSASAEYNSTAPSLSNHTIIPQGQWTNHTMPTDTNWLLGNHIIKIYANDTFDNMNATLQYLNFEIWGWSYILQTDIELTQNPIDIAESTRIRCKVTSDDSTPISAYTVSFYNSTSYLGSNTTDTSGWATYLYTDYTAGNENLTCNITDDTSKYYNASSTNEQEKTLATLEQVHPKWWQPTGSNITGKIHKGDYAYLYSNWTDNFMLSYGFLEWHNGTGWKNNTLTSPTQMSENPDWANFTIRIPTTMEMPNNLTWRVWANDTSGNLNVTENNTLDVWGWATVESISFNPGTILNGTTTNVECRVTDMNSSQPISGYYIEFWNESAMFGSNITDSDGRATFEYTDYSKADSDYNLICEISGNATLKYDTYDPINYKQDIIHIRTEDITAPNTTNYALNATQVQKGGLINTVNYLKIYAEWNEDINTTTGSYVSFNRSAPLISEPTGAVSGNWTNHTFTINQSWTVGPHIAKLNASDLSNNWNNTLPYLQFTVFGYSRTNMTSPQNGAGYDIGDIFYVICNITDEDSLTPIGGYKVSFYEEGNPIGTNYTGETGIAIYKVDTTGYSGGPYTYSCTITDNSTLYYNESASGNNEDSSTISISSILNVTIIEPKNMTNVNIGDTIDLKSYTKDPATPTTPDTANWYNTTAKLNPTNQDENYTWTIPVGHSIGPGIIKINVTKSSYSPDEKNITLYIWGYSNISWQSPAPESNYSQGSTIPLTCNVFDNYTYTGIENYNVSFYIENDTHTWYLGSNMTIATGNTTFDWFADPTIYSNGTYYPLCNITDNSTLYYNISSTYEVNSTINLTKTEITGAFEVSLIIPPVLSTTQAAQYRNLTVNATVKCINGACGTVNGTLQYSNQTIACTTIPEMSGTPFHINDGTQNPKTCGNMLENDECNISWVINATGALDTIYNISVLFTGTQSEDNRTQNATIEIKHMMIATITPDSISTWYARPNDGATNYNAQAAANWLDPGTNNSQSSSAVTVSLSEYSSDANGGIWILGANLTSIKPSNYEIPAYNMSGCTGNLTDYPTPNSASACLSNPANELKEHYTQFDTDLKSGESKQFVLFLDIPFGISSQVDGYTGTIWVKVNGTA